MQHQDNQGNNGNNVEQNDAENDGWPEWHEEQVAQNEPVQDEQPPQDQNSMVLSPSLGDSSSSDVEIIHVQDQQVQQVQPEFDGAAWAIVPYQPPVLQPPPIHVGFTVPFGHVLLLIWFGKEPFRVCSPKFCFSRFHLACNSYLYHLCQGPLETGLRCCSQNSRPF